MSREFQPLLVQPTQVTVFKISRSCVMMRKAAMGNSESRRLVDHVIHYGQTKRRAKRPA